MVTSEIYSLTGEDDKAKLLTVEANSTDDRELISRLFAILCHYDVDEIVPVIKESFSGMFEDDDDDEYRC